MKKMQLTITLLVLLASATFLFRCDPDKNSENCFSGKIVNHDGKPIPKAIISFGGKESKSVESSENGEFKICTRKSDRYVLNVTKLGFGFVSKIFKDVKSDIVITLDNATVVEVVNEPDPTPGPTPEPETGIETQPSDAVTITDTTPPPSEPLSAALPPNTSPIRKIPFVIDANGRLVGFGDPDVDNLYAAIESFTQPQQGATATVDPDDFVQTAEPAAASFFQDQSKEGVKKITGSINTIDLYSPDGMPGDFSIAKEDNGGGWMKTYGAADINFYADGKKLQLKKGKYARLTIPVDTVAQMYSKGCLAKEIPIMIYDKKTGFWSRDIDRWTGRKNSGYLNKEGTAYVALVSHFSIFNADDVFSNAACIRLCNAPSGASQIPPSVIVEIPSNWNWTYSFNTGCPTGGCAAGLDAFGISRLNPFKAVGMRLFEAGVIKRTYAFLSKGESADIHDDNCTTINNLPTCTSSATLDWALAESEMNPDGSGTMIRPVAASIDMGGGSIKISWVFIPERTGAAPPYNYTTMTPRKYMLEWTKQGGTHNAANTMDLLGGATTTNWVNGETINVSALAYAGLTDAPFEFRVVVFDLSGNKLSDALLCTYDVVGGLVCP